MAGEGGLISPVSRSGAENREEKGTMEEKSKVLGSTNSGNRVKRKKSGLKQKFAGNSKSLKPRSSKKRVAEIGTDNSLEVLKKRKSGFEESSSGEVEGDVDHSKGKINDGKSGVEMQTWKSDEGKYPKGVIKAEDWSGAERELRPRKQPQQQTPTKPEGSLLRDITLTEADARRILGRRIKVFWPLDDDWYFGTVESFDRNRKRHHVVYDDGDKEWLELGKEKFKIQLFPGDVFGKSGSAVRLKNSKARRVNRSKRTERKRKDGPVDVTKNKEGKKKKEEKKVKNDDIIKEEDQSAKIEDHEDAKKLLSPKQTAPRSKRARSTKQYIQKHTGQDQTDHVNSKEESAKGTDQRLDVKQNAENVVKEQLNAEDAAFHKSDDTDDVNGGREQHHIKQIDESPGKVIKGSDKMFPKEKRPTLSEVKEVECTYDKNLDKSGEVDVMESEEQPRKVENLDENEPKVAGTNQLDKYQTTERHCSKEANLLDENKIFSETGTMLTNQLDEKQLDISVNDERVDEKQLHINEERVDEKQADLDLASALNKKHGQQGSSEKLDEKQSYIISCDKKVEEKKADLDLASILGKKQGITRQRSRVKVRARDTVPARASVFTLTREGHSDSTQNLQSSPSREG
eukprot:Gb_28286 [translate_table: standard]